MTDEDRLAEIEFKLQKDPHYMEIEGYDDIKWLISIVRELQEGEMLLKKKISLAFCLGLDV